MVRVCEDCPACSVPLLHAEEIDVPDAFCADALNGEPAGNVVAPGIAVAVCANVSVLVNRTELPTASVDIAGENPPLMPGGIDDAG